MATLIAFGVGLGNLGKGRRQRTPAPAWIRQLNEALSVKVSGARIICSYGHTGNFVVSASSDPEIVASDLGDALGTPCAVMPMSELHEVVRSLQDCPLPSTIDAGVRFTRGAAFLIGTARDGLPPSTDDASYMVRRPNAVLLFKHDIETPSGVLDRNRRKGGWGAVATYLNRNLGGTWTARSIRTLAGIIQVADATLRDTPVD
jgi:hypothetical protein